MKRTRTTQHVLGILLLTLCIIIHMVHCRYSQNYTTVRENIKVEAGQTYHQQIDPKYFGVSTMLLKSSFHGNYYLFGQEQFSKFQKGEQAVALQEQLDIPSNRSIFFQVGTKDKTLQQVFPAERSIYFVAQNVNGSSHVGEIEKLSLSLVFLPPGWMIFLFVLIGLFFTAIFIVFLVILPLASCIGVGRIVEKATRAIHQHRSHASTDSYDSLQ